MLLDDFNSRSKHEMKSIAQNNIYIKLDELRRRQALDRSVGSNWHKCGCTHFPPWKAERARSRLPIASQNRESHLAILQA